MGLETIFALIILPAGIILLAIILSFILKEEGE